MGIINSRNKTYVTYMLKENGEFDKDIVLSSLNLNPIYSNKPASAFWGSPKNTNYGWKEFCTNDAVDILEEYDFEHPILWKLQKGSKIFRIGKGDVYANTKVLESYLTDSDKSLGKVFDFARMAAEGITAIELIDGYIGHRCKNILENIFFCWDCDSIVVLDPSKIIFLGE